MLREVVAFFWMSAPVVFFKHTHASSVLMRGKGIERCLSYETCVVETMPRCE